MAANAAITRTPRTRRVPARFFILCLPSLGAALLGGAEKARREQAAGPRSAARGTTVLVEADGAAPGRVPTTAIPGLSILWSRFYTHPARALLARGTGQNFVGAYAWLRITRKSKSLEANRKKAI